MKPANLERFTAVVSAGRVQPWWSSEVRGIAEAAVTIGLPDGGVRELRIDDTFVFIGGELPTRFLQDAGIAMDTRFGQP